MCVKTSQNEISGKNSHLLSQKVFIRSLIYPSEKTASSILAWGTNPPFFLHYVSAIKHYWSIKHCLLLLLFFNLIFHYFCFCSFLIIKKNCPWTRSMTGGPWTRSMKVVHGPGPKWGSMDPWSMFCPHPPGAVFTLFEGELLEARKSLKVFFLLPNL